MIVVDFFTARNGALVGFHIAGHADSGLCGSDVICASVSSAAYMTANTVTDIIRVQATASVDESGEMFLLVQEKDAVSCRNILSGFKLHVLALEEQYPKNIHVNYTEV